MSFTSHFPFRISVELANLEPLPLDNSKENSPLKTIQSLKNAKLLNVKYKFAKLLIKGFFIPKLK